MSYKPGNIVYGVKGLDYFKSTGDLSFQEANDRLMKVFNPKTSEQKIYEEAEKERLEAEKYKKYLDSLNN